MLALAMAALARAVQPSLPTLLLSPAQSTHETNSTQLPTQKTATQRTWQHLDVLDASVGLGCLCQGSAAFLADLIER